MATIYIDTVTLGAVVNAALESYPFAEGTFLLRVADFAGRMAGDEDSAANGAEAILTAENPKRKWDDIGLVRCAARLAFRFNN